jgi:alpha(1,3/1,4) fucosyltransferase
MVTQIYLRKRDFKKHKEKDCNFSVFGRRLNINIDNSDHKIFFTGENIHARFLEYSDLMLNNKNIDLSIGFDYLEHEKYIRFPIWLMNLFEPDESHYKTIKEKCKNWDIYNEINERDKFCAFLSRHDYFGDRLFFFNEISKIGKVDSDGEFMHNNDDLKVKFNDNKFEYLNNYKFNLCPENSNYPGYCTEKVFEAIKCGCIPVYWGSDNNPEPDILNHDAILFLNNHGGNDQALIKINQLMGNKKLFLDFVHQKRFTSQAPDVIFDFFYKLEQELLEIVKS